jgi:hypothetical protein
MKPLPLFYIWNSFQRRIKAVDVICAVTLITHELFLWFSLATANKTRTVFAPTIWIIMTVVTFRLVFSCKIRFSVATKTAE